MYVEKCAEIKHRSSCLLIYIYIYVIRVHVCSMRMCCTVNKNSKWFKIGYRSFARSHNNTSVYANHIGCSKRVNEMKKTEIHKNFEISIFFGSHPMKSFGKYWLIQLILYHDRAVCILPFLLIVSANTRNPFSMYFLCHHFCFHRIIPFVYHYRMKCDALAKDLLEFNNVLT